MSTSSPTLQIRHLGSGRQADWDAFVHDSAQGTPFALTAYLDAFGVQRDIVVAEGAGGIEAGIVLSRGLLGLPGNPLFVKHLGLMFAAGKGKPSSRVSKERRAARAIIAFLGKARGFDYAFAPGYTDWLPFFWSGFAQETRYTYRIPSELSAPWRDAADARLRNDLSRAVRAGLTFGTIVDLSVVVSLMQETYKRQGARPPMHAVRFQGALEALASAGMVLTGAVRSADGGVQAAALAVRDRRSAYLLVTGFAENAPPGATSLVIAGMIDAVHAHGLTFDFEGSMIEPIEAYYRGFGGILTPYFRIWRPGLLNSGKRTLFNTARRMLGYSR